MNRAIKNRPRAVKTLLFDVDNTIYPAASGLLPEVSRRIRMYLAQLFNISEAEGGKMANDYRIKYGSSLVGLVYNEGIDPIAYRDYVYDIDYNKFISRSQALIDLLAALPYEKIIYTNASRGHAESVLNILGVTDAFKMIVPVEDLYFYPKPQRQSFREMLLRTNIHPTETIFLDDQPENIIMGKNFGMGTVLVNAEHEAAGLIADLCIHELTDLQA